MSSPFLRPDDPRYEEVLTDALVHVLAERGIDRTSVGALARWMRVTPGAVLKSMPRARVVETVTIGFSRRWVRWARPDPRSGLPARLPRTEEEMHGVRVHLALTELARSERLSGNLAPSSHLAAFRTEERSMLMTALCGELGRAVPDSAVQSTAALVTGLRLAVAEHEPMPTAEAATRILRSHVDALRDP